MTDRRPNLHRQVLELTETHDQSTAYDQTLTGSSGSATTYTARWTTTHPPLIAQVWGSVSPSGQGGEVGSTTPSSKPSASLDSIDAAAHIDYQVGRWLEYLGADTHRDTIGAVRLLYSLTPDLYRCDQDPANGCCDYHGVSKAIRTWWIRARVLTGWESPAWKPDATCPMCGERRTVSVRWSSEVATCTACYESWDSETIGLLAEHIRLEAEEDRFARPVVRVVCSPAPELEEAGPRMMLCPDCGSSRCVKVLDQIVSRLPSHRAG